jgi:hypothetical protein
VANALAVQRPGDVVILGGIEVYARNIVDGQGVQPRKLVVLGAHDVAVQDRVKGSAHRGAAQALDDALAVLGMPGDDHLAGRVDYGQEHTALVLQARGHIFRRLSEDVGTPKILLVRPQVPRLAHYLLGTRYPRLEKV